MQHLAYSAEEWFRNVKFGCFGGGEVGEHNRIGLVDISKVRVTQNDVFNRTTPFDRLYSLSNAILLKNHMFEKSQFLLSDQIIIKILILMLYPKRKISHSGHMFTKLILSVQVIHSSAAEQ